MQHFCRRLKFPYQRIQQDFTAVFTVIVANSRLDFLAGSGKTFGNGIANPLKSYDCVTSMSKSHKTPENQKHW